MNSKRCFTCNRPGHFARDHQAWEEKNGIRPLQPRCPPALQDLIDNELTTCLLDNRAQLNFITPSYAIERGMNIMSLDRLAQEIGGQIPHIKGMVGSQVEPIRFVLMNVKVPCVQGYDKDQVTLVMDDPEMSECPVILGTLTLYQVMEVIKESEISKLAVPWSSS